MDTFADEPKLVSLCDLENVSEVRKISLKPNEHGQIDVKRIKEFDQRLLKNLEESGRGPDYTERDCGESSDDYGGDEERESDASYVTLRPSRVHSIQSSRAGPQMMPSFHSQDMASLGSTPIAESDFEVDSQFHQFICLIVHSTFFTRFIMLVILLNSVVIALDMELKNKSQFQIQLFPALNNLCLAIYTIEFFLKLYSDARQYWYSTYNVFDFVILIMAYVDLVLELLELQHDTKLLKLVRSMRTFRALRSISFIRGVQVIANALLSTLKELIVDVILLLMLMMFVFGIMGYYFFGYDATTEGVYDNWGTLSNSFLTLFTLVTMDRWTKFVDTLTEEGVSMYYSRSYIIIYLFVGHFIISNLFIAVIITNIESSSSQYKMKLLKERDIIVQDKKKEFWYRCKREVKWMMDKAHLDGSCNFQELATDFYFSLQKRDFVVMSDLKTNLIWLDTVNKEINRYQATTRRILGSHRDAVAALAPICSFAILDDRKTSISTNPRFNVQHKIGALALLQQPIKNYNADLKVKSRRLSATGKKRKSFLRVLDHMG